MRRLSSFAGLLVPLLVWSVLWGTLGKLEVVLAGVVFAAFMIPVWILRMRLDEREWGTVRMLGTATGVVLGLCSAILVSGWMDDPPIADPLAGEVDPLTYGPFEVVGRITSWDVLPIKPDEYEEWAPLLVRVSDNQRSFEFICDGSEVRDRLEVGRTIKATGDYSSMDDVSSTPVADKVEILD